MTKEHILRNIQDAVRSALDQDRERVADGLRNGTSLILARLIGVDGRAVDGIPNPWAWVQGPTGGDLPLDVHALVDVCDRRGAVGVVISGPVDTLDGPGGTSIAPQMITMMLSGVIAHLNHHDIAVLGIQMTQSDGRSVEVKANPALDGSFKPFEAAVDEHDGHYTLADILGLNEEEEEEEDEL